MKNIHYLIFILLFRITHVAAVAVEVIGAEDPTVGVRVLFNRGATIDEAGCSEHEHDTIHHLLLTAVPTTHLHNLRAATTVELPVCDNVCSEQESGTCYLIAPCRQDIKNAHIPTDEERVSMETLLKESDILKQICRENKRELLSLFKDEIIFESAGLSKSCKSFLGRHVDLQCHILGYYK